MWCWGADLLEISDEVPQAKPLMEEDEASLQDDNSPTLLLTGRPEVPLNIIGSFSRSEFQHYCLSLTSDKQKTNIIQKFQGHINKLSIDFKTWRLGKVKKKELDSRDLAWLYQPFQSSAFLKPLFTLSWTLSSHNFSHLSPLNKTQGLVVRMLANMAHLGLYNQELCTACTKLCMKFVQLVTSSTVIIRMLCLVFLFPRICVAVVHSIICPHFQAPLVSLNHWFLLFVLSSTNSLSQHMPLFSKQ